MNYDDGLQNKNLMEYPFKSYTMKEISDFSNVIYINKKNDGHSLDYYIDSELLNENNTYLQVLSYIKFLSLSIDKYNEFATHLEKLNIDVPNTYIYINLLIAKLYKYTKILVEDNKIILPYNLFEKIGVNINETDINIPMLWDIIYLLKDANYSDVDKKRVKSIVKKVRNDLNSVINQDNVVRKLVI